MPQHTLYKIFCNNIKLSFYFISVLIDLSVLVQHKSCHVHEINSNRDFNFLRFLFITFYCRNYVVSI